MYLLIQETHETFQKLGQEGSHTKCPKTLKCLCAVFMSKPFPRTKGGSSAGEQVQIAGGQDGGLAFIFYLHFIKHLYENETT